MPRDFKIAWFVIAFSVAIAIAFALLAFVGEKQANANSPSLVDNLIAVQPSLASRRDEPVDPLELAQAIATESKGDRQLAALMMTMAGAESALADRIRRGECKSFECDAYKDRSGIVQHKAWGLWQVHRNLFNVADWGSDDVHLQARAAARILRGAIAQCKKSGVAFPVSVFRAARGFGCTLPLKGEERRVATFNRIIGRL